MTAARWAGLLAGLLLLAGACLGRAAEADADLEQDIKTLREARVPTDGPGLLAYFKERTLSEDDRKKLGALVRLLGNDEFVVREKATQDLIKAGRLALPLLRPALRDPDLEIARRAERCLQQIESGADLTLTATAARVLAARRPPEAIPVLLAYLPSADEQFVEEAVIAALQTLGLHDGKPDPALVKALADKDSTRRAAAAQVIGKAKAEHRKPVARLLEDADPKVRFHAAVALARAGDRQAIPVLIAALVDAPEQLAWQAESLLCCLTTEQPPGSLGVGTAAERKKCREAWQSWWAKHADKADLARLNQELPLLGLNVIVEHDSAGKDGMGRVWACGPDGKPRWDIDTNAGGPIDAVLLPGGRVLISEYKANRVTERDRTGKVLWEHKTSSSAIAVQRLPNGNTFIGTLQEVLEVTRAGKVVFQRQRPGGSIWYARKLPNGHILLCGSHNGGEVVELEPTSGKELRKVQVGHMAGWGGVELLPNGRWLVALSQGEKLIEVDRSGKTVWECPAQGSPALAVRLRNGHTITALYSGSKVAEYDRSGKEVWSLKTQGRPFRIRRY